MQARAGIIGGVVGGFIMQIIDQLTFAVGISTIDTIGEFSRLLFGGTQASLLMWILFLIVTGLVGWLVSLIIPVRSMDSYFVTGIVVGVVLWASMNLIFTVIGITPTWSVGVGSFVINLISHVVLGISITYTLLKYKARAENAA